MAAVSHSERRLRLTGREVRDLAPLAGEWLLRGVSMNDLSDALTLGLPQPVQCAAGLIRDRLVRKMPDIPSIERQIAASSPPPRPRRLQSCAGGCGRLIRPVGEETQCRDCRLEALEAAAQDDSGAVDATRRGMEAVRTALRAAK